MMSKKDYMKKGWKNDCKVCGNRLCPHGVIGNFRRWLGVKRGDTKEKNP